MATFAEQSLKPSILKAISELGFENPTPIQEKVIPAILESNQDLIGLAQTGTGKTAGFGLPILNKLDISNRNVQAIVLSPTRELCLQITSDLKKYSKYVEKCKIEAIYGGARIEPQIGALKSGVHIVVGTPGRVLDMLKRRVLNLHNVQWLVLDEADEMLNMGFRDELDSIIEGTPETKQTLLFSATMPDGVRRISKHYMSNPNEISVGGRNTGADNVEHHYYVVRASDRYTALKRLADMNVGIYGIVFCRTRVETKDVASKLINDGYNADALHGDLSQAQRDMVMQRFRDGQLQLLVATDVAARGIDVNDLTHIINYNLPDDPEVYIHRSGRTGRAGKYGLSIIISHSREGRRIRDLQRLIGKKIELKKIPSGDDICQKRLFNLIDNVQKVDVNNEKIEPFMQDVFQKLEWLDRDELIKHFVAVEFNRFLEYYKGAKDINVDKNSQEGRGDRDYDRDRGRGRDRRGRDSRGGDRRSDRRSSDRRSRDGRDRRRKDSDSGFKGNGGRRSNTDFKRLYINIGEKQDLKVPNFIGLINDYTHNRDIEIGKIDLQRSFTFFEVDKEYSDLVVESFKGQKYGDTELTVEEASKPEIFKRNSDKKSFDKPYEKKDSERRRPRMNSNNQRKR